MRNKHRKPRPHNDIKWTDGAKPRQMAAQKARDDYKLALIEQMRANLTKRKVQNHE